MLLAFIALGVATAVMTTPGKLDGSLLASQAPRTSGERLRQDDTIQDLLNHPAFVGFARLLLPWDDRTYDGAIRFWEKSIGAVGRP